MAVQEADVATLRCYPGHPAWDRITGAIVKLFERSGGDARQPGDPRRRRRGSVCPARGAVGDCAVVLRRGRPVTSVRGPVIGHERAPVTRPEPPGAFTACPAGYRPWPGDRGA